MNDFALPCLTQVLTGPHGKQRFHFHLNGLKFDRFTVIQHYAFRRISHQNYQYLLKYIKWSIYEICLTFLKSYLRR